MGRGRRFGSNWSRLLDMAIGAWQGGLFYDLCGNYFPSFANASLGGVANLLVLALLYFHT